jgi:hypothetical protein
MESDIVLTIAINMLKLLKVLFLISMLIFMEHLDLVKESNQGRLFYPPQE